MDSRAAELERNTQVQLDREKRQINLKLVINNATLLDVVKTAQQRSIKVLTVTYHSWNASVCFRL